MQMYNSEHLQEKWAPILDYDGLDPIKDSHRRAVTAVLLENQEKELREERSFLSETPNMSTNSGSAAGFSADATAAGMCLFGVCWLLPMTTMPSFCHSCGCSLALACRLMARSRALHLQRASLAY